MSPFIILAAAIAVQTPSVTPGQQPWDYPHYDDRARERMQERLQESPQDKARREYQERWPNNFHHCRLPACSTK